MFSNTSLPEETYTSIQAIVRDARRLASDFFNYFRILAQEGDTLYLNRLENFAKLPALLQNSTMREAFYLIDEAIVQFSMGLRTTRYANLLKRLHIHLEKYGSSSFLHYVNHINMRAPQLADLSWLDAAFPYQTVLKTHQIFADTLLQSFFKMIDAYILKTERDIEIHRKQCEFYERPDPQELLFASGVRLLRGGVMAPVLSVSFNAKLARKKIELLSDLQADLTEHRTDAFEQQHISGLMVAACYHVKLCRDRNAELVAQQKYSSMGVVEDILKEILGLLLHYYPEEYKLAQQWHETSTCSAGFS